MTCILNLVKIFHTEATTLKRLNSNLGLCGCNGQWRMKEWKGLQSLYVYICCIFTYVEIFQMFVIALRLTIVYEYNNCFKMLIYYRCISRIQFSSSGYYKLRYYHQTNMLHRCSYKIIMIIKILQCSKLIKKQYNIYLTTMETN